VILLSRPRVDKADAQGFGLGGGLVPGHCHRAGEQKEIAAFHSFNPSAQCWTESIGDAPPVRQMLALQSQRTARAEAQLGSCRGPPSSAWSGQAAPGDDHAVSRRGLVLLHPEVVEPSRDVHLASFRCVPALPVSRALDLNRHRASRV